jgi:hypothetical protein
MSSPFEEDMLAVVQKHLGPLEEQEKQLSLQLENVRRQIAGMRQTLEVIYPGKKKGEKKRVNSRPTADEAQVLQAMTKAVKEAKSISRKDLQEKLKAKLAADGYALTGLPPRMEKLLKEPRFEVKGETVSIAQQSA